MYTYNEEWMGAIDARTNTNMLAYLTKSPIKDETMRKNFLVSSGTGFTSVYIQMNPAQTTNSNGKGWSYMTPAVWCLKQADLAQTLLSEAFQKEVDTLPSAK